MLLEAAAAFVRRREVELHIIGDGPERPHLMKVAADLSIENSVVFHGWLPHREVQLKLRECDAMVLPSIREFGGAAVVEAMALGVTPIVADYAGPSEHVDEETGIKVAFTDKPSLIQGLSDALSRIVAHPELLDKMGAAGRKKATTKLTWEAKAKQVLSVYDAVVRNEERLGHLGYQ
jgi:glycosyltransferase involved in cell wall biosynthesis